MRRKIALLQMDCVEGERARNRATVEAACYEARRQEADLLALPELWSTGYDLARATEEGGSADDQRFLAELSRDSRLALLGGSLLEPAAEGFHNLAVAYAEGRERGCYRKLHLFRPLAEDRYLKPGASVPETFAIADVCCGLTICYDLRFPDVYRSLAFAGVELSHVPAQWPRARIHHWRALLVARAIECQCYVLGVNRRG